MFSTSELRINLISSTSGRDAFILSFVALNSLRDFSRMCTLPSNLSSFMSKTRCGTWFSKITSFSYENAPEIGLSRSKESK